MDSSIIDFLCYQVSGRVNDLCSRILSSLELEETKHVPMMGVRVRNRHFVLSYNPHWIAKACYDDVAVTVKHEAYHLLLGHIPRHLELEARYKDSPDTLRTLQLVSGFAADMAANSLLVDEEAYMRNHSAEWILPGYGNFQDMKKKQSFEWYVRKLIERMKNKPEMKQQLSQILISIGFGGENENSKMFQTGDEKDKSSSGDESGSGNEEGEGGVGGGGENEEDKDGEGEGEGGKKKPGLGISLLVNHRDWNDVNLQQSDEKKINLADELSYQLKTIVKQAITAHEKSRGTVPAGLQEIIGKILKEPQVPWARVFRNIVANGRRTRRTRSLSRIFRRHIAIPELLLFPGKKKDFTYHVAFLIDTSGSMGSRELEMALNELEGMRKVDKEMSVTVIEADAVVEREYELGSGKEIKYDVKGRGGTSFDPALRRAKELRPRPDAVFYFTDGFAPAPHKKNRVPCLFAWILTPNGKVPDEWGIVISTKADD